MTQSIGLTTRTALKTSTPFLTGFLIGLVTRVRNSIASGHHVHRILAPRISQLQTSVGLLLTSNDGGLQTGFPGGGNLLLVLSKLSGYPPGITAHLFFSCTLRVRRLRYVILCAIPVSALCTRQNVDDTFNGPRVIPVMGICRCSHRDLRLTCGPSKLGTVTDVVRGQISTATIFRDHRLLLSVTGSDNNRIHRVVRVVESTDVRTLNLNHAGVRTSGMACTTGRLRFHFRQSAPHARCPRLTGVTRRGRVASSSINGRLLFDATILRCGNSGH